MTFNVPSGSGGGGGGGSYTGGNGISLAGGTITNTGTIVQPAATGSANGIDVLLQAGLPGPSGTAAGHANLYAPPITASPDGTLTAGGVNVFAYGIYGSGTAAALYGPTALFGVGSALIPGIAEAGGAQVNMQGGYAFGNGTVGGAGIFFQCGDITNGTGTAGGINFLAGNGSTGGNVVFEPGTGTTNGVILLNNQGTIGTDPHVLNADWVKSVAAVGYVVMRSQG